ncbi:MAG: hypothetical protein JO021_24040 [Alphaproteobacteria bacterium]|nr:hypothetical protein [Alphaproteobacteria bacterium]
MAFPGDLLDWLEDTAPATAIRESELLFPSVETVHVMALAIVVGTIAYVDLRLLRLAAWRRPITAVAREVLPWTWTGFAVAAVSGALLFSSNAVKYYGNTPFRLKMLLLALAGLNMLAFQVVTWRGVARWDRARPPLAAQWAGGLSLVFWIGIVAMGRWIGFTMK